MRRFDAAIKDIGARSVRDPQKFTEYLRANGMDAERPAPVISVQSLNGLSAELREANIMVLRTGNGHFGLVRAKDTVKEYFIIDSEEFPENVELFIPTATYAQLVPFALLPTLVEAGLVNLALASGLVASFLNLDDGVVSLPATGQSTFTFEVRPRRDIASAWVHRNGQVEVDALFVGVRQGRPHMFVLECKVWRKVGQSMAKHKLTYAVSAVSRIAPPGLPIVPMYLSVHDQGDGTYDFCLAECSWQHGQSVEQLEVTKSQRYRLLGVHAGNTDPAHRTEIV